jgi:hypothetical protein
MVVRRAAPSSLRMIIRSIVEAVRGLDNVLAQRRGFFASAGADGWDFSISILGSDTHFMNSFPTGVSAHFLPVEWIRPIFSK